MGAAERVGVEAMARRPLKRRSTGSAAHSRLTHLGASYFFVPRIASFAVLATRNFITLFAGILMLSPVAGSRPILALRLCRTSLPMPGMVKPFLACL